MENMPNLTAAVTWTDTGGAVHIRVYSSDGYTVTERCFDGGGPWTDGAFKAAGSQVSAICWQDSAGAHLRVYCTFEDSTTEWCADANANWYQGDYTP
jgi:hypothetical protein